MLELNAMGDINWISIILRFIAVAASAFLFVYVYKKNFLKATSYKLMFGGLIGIMITIFLKMIGSLFIPNATHELIFMNIAGAFTIVGMISLALGLYKF